MHKYKVGDKIIMMESRASAKTGDIGTIIEAQYQYKMHKIKFESGKIHCFLEKRFRLYIDTPTNAELF